MHCPECLFLHSPAIALHLPFRSPTKRWANRYPCNGELPKKEQHYQKLGHYTVLLSVNLDDKNARKVYLAGISVGRLHAAVPPLQHPQCAQGIPTAWCAHAFNLEVPFSFE